MGLHLVAVGGCVNPILGFSFGLIQAEQLIPLGRIEIKSLKLKKEKNNTENNSII